MIIPVIDYSFGVAQLGRLGERVWVSKNEAQQRNRRPTTYAIGISSTTESSSKIVPSCVRENGGLFRHTLWSC